MNIKHVRELKSFQLQRGVRPLSAPGPRLGLRPDPRYGLAIAICTSPPQKKCPWFKYSGAGAVSTARVRFSDYCYHEPRIWYRFQEIQHQKFRELGVTSR